MTGGLKVAFFIGRNKMRELWNMLQAVFTGIGGWLGYFLGGCDGLLYALIAFTVIDYIRGLCAGLSITTYQAPSVLKASAER